MQCHINRNAHRTKDSILQGESIAVENLFSPHRVSDCGEYWKKSSQALY